MGLIAILAAALVIKNNEIKEIFKKKKINIELINNDKISKDYLFKKISVKEGQSFWKFNHFLVLECYCVVFISDLTVKIRKIEINNEKTIKIKYRKIKYR